MVRWCLAGHDKRLTLTLAGYVLARATLGALVNPPFNGPDEYGHWQYVQTLVETGGRRIAGVEAQQPAFYYALAALPWLATEGAPLEARLFWLRFVSVLAGLATLTAVWLAARRLWPSRPILAVAAGVAATLAPGHLYLLASVSNDPLAEALASFSLLAALRLSLPAPMRTSWWWVWAITSAAAVATKLSTAPAIGGATVILLVHYHRAILSRLGRRWALLLLSVVILAAIAIYLSLLSHHPATSRAASIAHFWPLALIRGPIVYLSSGVAESFRTFWYAYDYAVRWPISPERLLFTVAIALSLLAVLGLAQIVLAAALTRLRPSASHEPAPATPQLPLILWVVAGTQMALVVARIGLADVLQIEMGGAAQAKAFFPAILPLALLLTGGLAATAQLAGKGDDRWVALPVIAAFFLLDWVSLAMTLWHHYRWWQVGL